MLDALEVAEWAARAAVAVIAPRPEFVEDVYSAGMAGAWEAVSSGSVLTWAGARREAVPLWSRAAVRAMKPILTYAIGPASDDTGRDSTLTPETESSGTRTLRRKAIAFSNGFSWTRRSS